MHERLDADKVVKTVARLHLRVLERFPDSGLAGVCQTLCRVAHDTRQRARWIARPLVGLRVAVGAFVGVVLAGIMMAAASSEWASRKLSLPEFVQVLEAGINDIILIGAAIFFLVTIESRIKRRRALRAIDELRALIHVVDMHQLTKDPERLLLEGPSTPSSPERRMTVFELTRYLDYCSEMLALIGKVAALYAQNFNDAVALAAVTEIENLSTGTAGKIWQKLVILSSAAGGSLPAPGEALGPTATKAKPKTRTSKRKKQAGRRARAAEPAPVGGTESA